MIQGIRNVKIIFDKYIIGVCGIVENRGIDRFFNISNIWLYFKWIIIFILPAREKNIIGYNSYFKILQLYFFYTIVCCTDNKLKLSCIKNSLVK